MKFDYFSFKVLAFRCKKKVKREKCGNANAFKVILKTQPKISKIRQYMSILLYEGMMYACMYNVCMCVSAHYDLDDDDETIK